MCMKSLKLLLSITLVSLIVAPSLFSQVESSLNVYNNVDKQPKLKGSGKNISQYIQKQVNYSDDLKINGIEGDVWVSFVVTAQGDVENVEIEKGIEASLDEKVRHAVISSGKWKPGEINKKKVNTQMRLPVRFTLTSNERQFAQQIKALNDSGKRPLFVLDNELIDGVIKLESYNLKSVRLIKGQKAINLYGKRAEYGVVVMTTKNGTPPLF